MVAVQRQWSVSNATRPSSLLANRSSLPNYRLMTRMPVFSISVGERMYVYLDVSSLRSSDLVHSTPVLLESEALSQEY